MFVPEYSITPEILSNISTIEYGKAIIESVTILKHWKKQLKTEARAKTIKYSLEMDEKTIELNVIKRYLNKIGTKTPGIVKSFKKTLDHSTELIQTDQLDEDTLKQINNTLIKRNEPSASYRNTKTIVAVDPDQILAEIVGLFDWYNSLDAKQTHPILLTGILHGQLKKTQPYNLYNFSTTTIASRACLKINNYAIEQYVGFEKLFSKNKKMYEDALNSIVEDDFTSWLEYYTDITAREVSNQKEKMILLAKDTKIAKVSGGIQLSERQERIVAYLQDFGLIQNKDFAKIFPDISEDTVLRELKELIKMGIVVKKGKTKASRYELA